MLRSMFSGVSGLRTHQNKMDVIGNNIANVNTAGFKSARATFMDSIYQSVRNSSSGNNVYGGTNASQLGYGSQLASVDVNHAPGSYEPTGYGTDCMINGGGYFMVGPKSDANGVVNGEKDSLASNLKLTRVGKFTVDGDGYLVDVNGNVVYGFVPLDDPTKPITGTDPWKGNPDQMVPLRVPVAAAGSTDYEINHVADPDKKPMELNNISIDEGGVISGIGKDGTVYKFGQVAIANVPNPNGLENQGNSYYKAINNTGYVRGFAPGEGTTGKLISNCLEMSNVDLATEFSNMITTQRGFQACSKMITISDEMLQELVNMKR